MQKMKSKKGLTFLEAITAVSLFGLMLAIAYPAYRVYRINAKLSEVPMRLSSIQKGLLAHYFESDVMSKGNQTQKRFLNIDDPQPYPIPKQKAVVVDWASASVDWAAIYFAPPEPLSFSYNVVSGEIDGQQRASISSTADLKPGPELTVRQMNCSAATTVVCGSIRPLSNE